MAATTGFQPHLAGADSSVVVVIDLQERLLPLIDGYERLTKNMVKLIRLAGLFGVPVILTEQYPQGLGRTTPVVKEAFDALTTEKHFVVKDSFSCNLEPTFIEKLVEIEQRMLVAQSRIMINDGIRPRPIDVIIAGIESHVCVWQTVMGLLPLEYYVRVVHDCVGSRDAANKKWALLSMLAMGALVTSHESVAFEWARDKNHPQFRAMNRMMKE